jgi:hypothetical protein
MRYRYAVCIELPNLHPRPRLNRRATRLWVDEKWSPSIRSAQHDLIVARKKVREIRRLWASRRIRVVLVDLQTGKVFRRERI